MSYNTLALEKLKWKPTVVRSVEVTTPFLLSIA